LFAIDEVANASPARRWPPLGKLFLTLALLLASLLSGEVVVPLMVLAIGLGLLFHSTALRLPRVVALALLDGALIIVIGAAVIAAVTPGTPAFTLGIGQWAIVLTDRGIAQGALVLTRSLAGVAVMLFFATSTPIPHLAHALRRLRVPKEITELTILVYRYSFLVLEQSERMFLAARCRLGFKGLRTSLRTFSQVAVGMFTRSVEVAERSQTSLACRNFQGDFPTFREPARVTAAWLAAPAIAFVALVLLDRMLQGVIL